MSRSSLRFLAALPFSLRMEIEGIRVVVVHGTPHKDMDAVVPGYVTEADLRRWLDDAEADVLLVGHTHVPFAIQVPGGGLVASPGAVYRRPEGKVDEQPWRYDSVQETLLPGATHGGGTFGMLELPSLRFTVRDAGDGHEVEIVRELA